jgi:ABC-type multidrug transport system ATPase subunit
MPTLSFQNITVSVPDVKGPKRYLPSACVRNQNRKEVLHNVSGRFPNKGIVAIMGPSGSGKTTFLNAVSNRMAIGGSSGVKCSGAVRVDGQVVEPEFFYSKSVSFVPQDTCLFAELTPREAIRFSTTLIFPTLNPEAVETRVTKTIAAMGLQKCADTQVGNEMFRGVSGGERKR